MTDLGPLTEDEIELILARRAEKAAIERLQARRMKALETTARYGRWLFENGYGTSFSTFINQFGYQEHDGQEMYADVTLLLDAVEGIS